MFDNELEHVDYDSLSESENLASDSLSVYDCDSEGGNGWSDADDEDSDSGERGTCKPGVMGLKFQLDAARAGGLQSLSDGPWLTEPHSPAFHQ
jgi:hypothetical protein